MFLFTGSLMIKAAKLQNMKGCFHSKADWLKRITFPIQSTTRCLHVTSILGHTCASTHRHKHCPKTNTHLITFHAYIINNVYILYLCILLESKVTSRCIQDIHFITIRAILHLNRWLNVTLLLRYQNKYCRFLSLPHTHTFFLLPGVLLSFNQFCQFPRP